MLLELMASLAAAVGAAGIMLLVVRLSGRRLPRWLVPAAVGLAMLGYTLWSEYTWGNRIAARLPEGVVEVVRVDERIWWKPWTLAVPQTTRMMAANIAGAATREDAPGVRIVTLYFFARWMSTRSVPVLIDCAAGAQADASEAALADPRAATWLPLGADDPLIRAVCGGVK